MAKNCFEIITAYISIAWPSILNFIECDVKQILSTKMFKKA